MLTLVQIQSFNTSNTASAETASLVADYLAFDRQRTWRRQYMKAFGGIAILVLLGGAFGRVPWNEAQVVAGLLLLPPLLLAAVEAIRWRRLVRRLDTLRAQGHAVKKS
jgi:uncharacterized membrane protein